MPGEWSVNKLLFVTAKGRSCGQNPVGDPSLIQSLETNADAKILSIFWETGETTELSAATLRREAMDAHTRRERIDTGNVVVAPDISITGVHHMGLGGVNICFSDGHDRALFPYPYLRELSERFDN
jgi:DUF971 family protein